MHNRDDKHTARWDSNPMPLQAKGDTPSRMSHRGRPVHSSTLRVTNAILAVFVVCPGPVDPPNENYQTDNRSADVPYQNRGQTKHGRTLYNSLRELSGDTQAWRRVSHLPLPYTHPTQIRAINSPCMRCIQQPHMHLCNREKKVNFYIIFVRF